MYKLAEILSKPFPHVRVDFFELKKGNPVIGELTFYTGNGTDKFEPIEWDYKLGNLINIG